jgi:phosphoribosylamine--glycine ligase
LSPAQDFKRVGTGDRGPNTGGMGAYSPVPAAADVVARVMEEAVRPTLAELQARGIDYRGTLYAGLMLTADGPRVLEFNVRFGDPETQVVLPRWDGDVAATLAAAAAGRLEDGPAPSFPPAGGVGPGGAGAAVCVVLAAPGYPAAPEAGAPISGLLAAAAQPGVQIYCAGVAAGSRDGELVTAGGRVLGVGATGPDLETARRRAYLAIPTLGWPGLHYRTDIASGDSAAVRSTF